MLASLVFCEITSLQINPKSLNVVLDTQFPLEFVGWYSNPGKVGMMCAQTRRVAACGPSPATALPEGTRDLSLLSSKRIHIYTFSGRNLLFTDTNNTFYIYFQTLSFVMMTHSATQLAVLSL